MDTSNFKYDLIAYCCFFYIFFNSSIVLRVRFHCNNYKFIADSNCGRILKIGTFVKVMAKDIVACF